MLNQISMLGRFGIELVRDYGKAGLLLYRDGSYS